MGILFFFGAGASKGCGDVYPYQPPLGSELFDELCIAFPITWGKLPSDVKEKFRKDFEEGMGFLWENYSQIVPILMKEVGIYFSKFRINKPEENLYYKLIKLIKSKQFSFENTIFSTLNYDCLIEIAASMNGLAINYFKDPSKDVFTLWKLHGSCNFKIVGVEARDIQYTRGVCFDGDIDPIQPNMVPIVFNYQNALYPAMSIYTRGKPNQIASINYTKSATKMGRVCFKC